MNREEEIKEKRRAFIMSRLNSKGYYDYSDIREAFGVYESNHANLDLKAIENVGYKLESRKHERTTRVFWLGSRSQTVKQIREKVSLMRKEEIANLATSIVCGFEGKDDFIMYRLSAQNLLTEEEILGLFPRAGETRSEMLKLKQKLKAFWRSRIRTVALDSGTSTDAIANCISPLQSPNHYFTHLNVWTNSRAIFQLLGQPHFDAKTVIIGGEQRYHSESISGELTKKCLEAWNPRFGIAIVGATWIDIKKGRLEAYNDSEASLKSELLQRSSLRVVVADATKFDNEISGGGSAFTKILPKFVDLIITDSQPCKENAFAIPDMIDGVPILKI